MTAKPRKADGRPALPNMERLGWLRGLVPIPHVENILLSANPRTIDADIPAGRIVISAFITQDNDGFWAAFFPGWLTNAAGRFIVIEMDNIDFDRSAARDYVVENLLPADVTPSDTPASTTELLESVKPQATEQIAKTTAAEIDPLEQFAEWVFARHSETTPTSFETLCEAAKRELERITKTALRTAYQRVYDTQPHRPLARGWPLKTPYKERWQDGRS